MILPFSRINKSGVKEQFWTHSSFLPVDEVDKIERLNGSRCTYRNYLGFFSGVAGLVLNSNSYVQKVIPKTVPALGVPLIFGAVGFALGHVIFVQGFTEKRINELKSNTTMPLWKDKKNVVNLNRVFFHLDESKNNSPDLLYHGLTGENASKIFPDAISGPAPKPPQQHDHGHGHGHGHGQDHH